MSLVRNPASMTQRALGRLSAWGWPGAAVGTRPGSWVLSHFRGRGLRVAFCGSLSPVVPCRTQDPGGGRGCEGGVARQ